MKLFYKSKGERIFLADFESAHECCLYIHDYLTKHNFRSYYWRVLGGEVLTVDFGSYTDFFQVEDVEFELFCEAVRDVEY